MASPSPADADDQTPTEPATDPATEPRIRVVLLFGGQSAEHDVSRISARHVLAAADPTRYDIQPIGITKAGQWVLAEGAATALMQGADALPESLEVAGRAVDPLPTVAPVAVGEQVVVFPILHGPMGEDGTVQGMLELANVAYVGCGVLSSALAMDKAKAKEVFTVNGIPQAEYRAFHETDVTAVGVKAFARDLGDDLGFPIFVKPANMGSSIGVSKARDVDELSVAIELALTYDEWLVCEEGVIGREIECAVLGNLEPRASVPGEIVPGADFYDYEDKYFDGKAVTQIPADLSPGRTAELQEMAVRAYRALRCEGMARVDFFLEEPGRGLLVNEINTIPGFTPISMYPKMWEASGLPYDQLIDELIRLALDRRDRRASKRRVD
jgi:D-alanine-D-alanine ligase